jgi:hypothetical protein
MAGATGVAGTAGSKEESRKSLRIRSGSTGEFDGRFSAGLGGVSVNGAGRLRALPFGLATPAHVDTVNLGLLGDAEPLVNAAFKR